MSASKSKGVPLNGKYLRFPSKKELSELFGAITVEAAHGLAYATFLGLGKNGEIYRPLVTQMIKESAPRGAYEGILVSQLVAAHVAYVTVMGKMWVAEDDGSREALSRIALRTSQTFSALFEKLRVHRSRGQTNINISQVTVQNGGKAIVGSVSADVPRNEK